MAGPHALQLLPTPTTIKKTKNLAWLYGVVGGLVGLFLIGGAVSNDQPLQPHLSMAWERMGAHLRAHAAGRDAAWHPFELAIRLDETPERQVPGSHGCK